MDTDVFLDEFARDLYDLVLSSGLVLVNYYSVTSRCMELGAPWSSQWQLNSSSACEHVGRLQPV